MSISSTRLVRSITSTKQWYGRHSSDPFVQQATSQGLRSRSSFKLEQLHQRFKLFKSHSSCLDLGAFPGGWSQIAKKYTKGIIVAVDITPMDPLDGVVVLTGDIHSLAIQAELTKHFTKGVDIVLSDMAHKFTGMRSADVPRVLDLCEFALSVAEDMLVDKGTFLCKVMNGNGVKEFKSKLETRFDKVLFEKPDASRKESSEAYFICTGYKNGSVD